MRLFVLLGLISASSVDAAGTVRVQTFHENRDECATWLDDYMFNETLYKEHFNSYYNQPSLRAITTEKLVDYPRNDIDASVPTRTKRDMLKSIKLWPNATIPYLLSCDYTESERVFIATVMLKLEENTCLRYVPYDGHIPGSFMYVDATARDMSKCSTTMGVATNKVTYEGNHTYTRGSADINFPKMCFGVNRGTGTIMHEMMHVVGFYHQQDRFDSGREADNSTVSEEESRIYGPYDPYSVISYSNTRYLTDLDLFKINKAYNCSRTTRGNQPIDTNREISSKRTVTGKICTMPVKCPQFNGKPKKNVATFTVDFQRNTLNYTNVIEPMFDDCWSDSNCLLPYMKISKEGDRIETRIYRDKISSECTVVSMWSQFILPSYQQVDFPVNVCTIVIETDDGKTLCIAARF